MIININYLGYIRDNQRNEWEVKCEAEGKVDCDGIIESPSITEIKLTWEDHELTLDSLAFLPDIFPQLNINDLEEEIITKINNEIPYSQAEERDYWNYTQGR